MPHVIFVCTGNLCRSPMAEGIMRARLNRMSRNDISVSSMGIYGLQDQPPTGLAREVCEENGIDISSHRSRPLVGDELVQADLILTMDRAQRDFVRMFFPMVRDRVFLLGEWPLSDDGRGTVRDPIGRSKRVYRDVYGRIDNHIERLLPYLQGM